MLALKRFGKRNSLRTSIGIMEASQPPPSRRQRQKAAKRHLSTTPSQKVFGRNMLTPLASPVPQDGPRFADLAKENLLDPVLLKTIIQDLKFDRMMPVQAATLHDLLAKRIDCLAQAKTGTGKTIAFLLPAIQTLLNKSNRSGVSLLVISPTRELAMQIAKEATALLKNHPRYKVCVAIGGTNKFTEQNKIRGGCDILVATPGRLNDHMADAGFSNIFKRLDTLVLDEADRLLDMGFMNALKDIISCLPNKQATRRQGMLFSATIAPHVEKVAHLVLSPGYKFISTIPEGESNTHERVPQQLIVVPTFSDVAAGLVGSIRQEMKVVGANAFRAIIFAPTARLVDFYLPLLESMPGFPKVSQLHSRLSQAKRTRITQDFRTATSGILVATDVIARGMDFPNVTNVFQVGLPADKESYIHRLGRTARAGAEGRGTFIIAEDERFFPLQNLKDINFEEKPAELSAKSTVYTIAKALDNHGSVYQAWLGYYKGHCKGLGYNSQRLVAEANRYALEGLGAAEVPGLEPKIIGKMGLKGVSGIIVRKPEVMGFEGGPHERIVNRY